MPIKKIAGAALASVTALALVWACAGIPTSSGGGFNAKLDAAHEALAKGEWLYWGGDPQTTRYSPLRQINASNLDKLEVAWRWTADGSGESGNWKASPLMADGVLYVPWLDNGAAAIDAATGKTVWTFRPPAQTGGRGGGMGQRSLSYWTDGTTKRLFNNSSDGRLIAIDAKTGKLATEFGAGGIVALKENVNGKTVQAVSAVSPALVVGDVIAAQVIPGGTRGKTATPGVIRGYDVRTGKLLWTNNPIPQKGEPGAETWENGSNEYTGHAGTWTMMSADPELGYLYIPHETATNEFYGGQRLGDNLYGETLECIDAKTGKRIWHFQTIHHGLWDYDLPIAPVLHDIVKDGKRIKAVTQLTKQSLVFTFDRKTGEPVWPINEEPAPQSGAVPGERPSKTQPIPTRPQPMLDPGYHEDLLIDFTPELRAEAKKIADTYTKGPLYTLPSEITPTNKGTWLYPGTGGGPNWNGVAVDPETNMMYTPMRVKVQSGGLRKGNPANTDMDWNGGGGGAPVEGPRGLPILKPPYSVLLATDMNTGEHGWRVPIGGAPDFVRKHPALQGLGLDFDHMGMLDVRPSPLLTHDVLFLGEGGNLSGTSGGPMFRAFDKVSGKVVWEKKMPGIISAGPMTYMVNGKQYIAVTLSERGKPAEIVTLTLGDGKDDAGVAMASAAPAGVLSAPRPRLDVTPAELTMGRDAFARTCAVCHGQNGVGIQGGSAPALTDRTDVAAITRVINEGKGEMSSMSAMLKPEEVSATAKFIASGMQAQRPAGAPGGPGGARAPDGDN